MKAINFFRYLIIRRRGNNAMRSYWRIADQLGFPLTANPATPGQAELLAIAKQCAEECRRLRYGNN